MLACFAFQKRILVFTLQFSALYSKKLGVVYPERPDRVILNDCNKKINKIQLLPTQYCQEITLIHFVAELPI